MKEMTRAAEMAKARDMAYKAKCKEERRAAAARRAKDREAARQASKTDK